MGLASRRLARKAAAVRNGGDAEPERPGSDEAFRRYVLPEVDVLYRVARSVCHNPADAEDLVQETLLRAFRGIDRFDGRYPRAWLLTILRNTHINIFRKQLRAPSVVTELDGGVDRLAAVPSGDTDPETAIVEQSLDHAVTAALAAVPAGFRQVIELVDMNGLSYEEAATLLDIPMGTVMSRLHRGRARIRAQLGDRFLSTRSGP